MSQWSLIYEGFDPSKEKLREALCTLGNGYFATRGAGPESRADGIHYPGTYLAGGYNRLKTEIAGRVIENEDLVNLPNWLPLSFRVDGGRWFKLSEVEILAYRQELELKRGVLIRNLRFRDAEDRVVKLLERRLVHMEKPHMAALETTIEAENWSGHLEICSALDGRVVNAGVERYKDLNHRHLDPLYVNELNQSAVCLKVQTNQSDIRIAMAARTGLFKGDTALEPERWTAQEEGYIGQHLELELSRGEKVRVEKIVALYTSRDSAVSECGLEARKAVQGLDTFESLLESHSLAWKHLWEQFKIDFQQKDREQGTRTGMILHLYIFHLLQTTSIHTMDLDVGVPSRGWHGEAYRGHVFWDELFIFPLLNLRIPEITRSLLMYRYRRLDMARTAAKAGGYQGAMFPWQSGSNGREESQVVHLNPKSGRWIPDNSHLQRHVNAAIAYNIYQYFQVSGDEEFMCFYGAEMFMEIARFWSSISTYNEALGRYEILGVMGPDEYHDGYPDGDGRGLKNNAYTNVMAVWVLDQGLRLLDMLPEDRSEALREKLDIRADELERWREITRKMRIVFHGDGIISQFEGYDRLEEFDWEGYRERYGDIQRLDRILEAEGDTPNRYKASKQADVLMLFYLFSAEELYRLFQQLGYPLEYESIPKNIDYYLQRTSHGSTLSRIVHSWVLARSDRIGSWKMFAEALESDVSDIQGGTTPEGIHLGAMAGSVDVLQEGYTGIETRDDVLWFNPCIPEELGELKMQIRYRGQCLEIEIGPQKMYLRAFRCGHAPIKVGFQGDVFALGENETREFEFSCGIPGSGASPG